MLISCYLKRGAKVPGEETVWGETTRGGNGLGAKRPGFPDLRNDLD